ncbi:MAG TPA: O-acetyl-ADP-ribose deacetylase [Rectinemataceae bacterium]
MKLIGEFLGGRLIVEAGDITEFRGGAIVNAANSSLLGGGGVDGAIHASGGPSILAECKALRSSSLPDGLAPGKAVATTAGRLKAVKVIHTVGPVWAGGQAGEPETLASCYRSSLSLAAELELDSIAFPAISTGVYRYPKHLAAKVAYDVIASWVALNDLPSYIHLVFFSEADARLFAATSGILERCP